MDRSTTAVLAAAAAVKLGLAARWDLLADEAYHWTWALAPDWGYYDQPPLVAWVLALERGLLGDHALALRAGPIGLWLVAVGAAATLVEDRPLWLTWALGLPALAFLTQLAVPDALLLGCWLLGLVAAARGRWGWAGLWGGLASLCKYSGVALVPMLILAADPDERRTRGPWVAQGLALALLAPNLFWNAGHDWVSVRFVVGEGLLSPHAPGLWGPPEQLLDQALVVGPIAAAATAVALFQRVRAWRTLDRVDRIGVATSLPLLAGFAVAALGGPPEAHWTAPAWLGVGLVLARSSGRVARAAWLGAAFAALGSGLLALHSLIPLADWDDDPGTRLTEGRVLGDEVARWVTPAADEPAARPVLTERYQEAALIRWNTGIEARVLPGCGRRSQDDLEPRPLPPTAIFVRPMTGGPPRCALARCSDVHGPEPIRTVDPQGRRVGPWDVFELAGCR